MSTSARWREARAVLERVDPVLAPGLLAQWDTLPEYSLPPLSVDGHVVLVGQRAAGKTTLLPLIAALLRRQAFDLDEEIARHAGCGIEEVFARGEDVFRKLERRVFMQIAGSTVVAAGGGFLSHHADLLMPHLAVLVPVSAATQGQRLQSGNRPRLRPEHTLDDEIATVFAEREALHARTPTMPLIEFLSRAARTP